MKILILMLIIPLLAFGQQASDNNSFNKTKLKKNTLNQFFLQGSKEIIIDINNLKTPVRNNGIIFETTTWPRPNQFQESDLFFFGGFYLTGKNDNQWWANAVPSSARTVDYLPGKVGSNPNDTLNVIYVVRSSDSHFG